MSTASNYRRQLVLDALDDYAEFLTAEREALEGRIENLRAALASIGVRAENGAVCARDVFAFEPLQIAMERLAAAARGALEADDRETERR